MWPRIPLKSISVLGPQYGANLKAVSPSGRGVRYVRITDIDDFGQLRSDSVAEPDGEALDDYILLEGDLLLARTGATVGKTYRYQAVDGKCAFAGYLIRFRPDVRVVSSNYLSYYFQTKEYWAWIQSKKRVAAQPNINGAEYASLEIPLPPLREQNRIIELLDEANCLRRLRRDADAKAARILPALFLKMFGDPITNPKQLRKKSLGELIKVKSGNFLPAKDMAAQGIFPVYGGNGVNGYHDEFMFEERKVVLGRVGAYCGAVHYSAPKSWITDNALYVSEKLESIDDYYLVAALEQANLNQYAGRAGQPLISGSRIYPVEILVPPENLQIDFSQSVSNLLDLDEIRASASARLDQLWDLLMSQAFSGQLTAKWREDHMQELLVEMEQQARLLNLPWPIEREIMA